MQKRVYRQGWFMTVLKCDVGSAAWLLEPTYASTDHRPDPSLDRQRVVEGKRVPVRVDRGGRRSLKQHSVAA